MSTDSIIGAMTGMAQDRTQMGIQTALIRNQNQADQQVLQILDEAVQAAPAPGTGLVVDKRA
ncbi:hypothetical protein E8L99_04155 [Phreatobacter aquaticus]|uniref:Motility protein n=1 Tax=Phreatobacter aquaticus TaxID=2570229 RepID=A0A4D7QE67_9HYPH|nr:hypothetical protein [Phreatobacter aquaticus]QCK85025.1 hypothetical protein E8L99_04155 [Phreatobacter aquaticus]